MNDVIRVRGARQHNLKNLTCELPRNRLVVLTGPSGSGKSSLAFDTIYAEGQRRYVESLSAYARQFLEQLAKPDVDGIDGLSPAIAIEQAALTKSPRSTVGTVTEIADYLRVLFARVGVPHCPSCGSRIEAQTVQQIVDRILAMGEGARLSLMAPIARARKGELKLELEKLRRDGFVRARIDGQIVDLGDDIILDRSKPHDLDVVVDRVVIKDGLQSRVTDSVELALRLGEGLMLVDQGQTEPVILSERFACVTCGISLPPIEPRLFSFNGPHGACPACDGLGSRIVVEIARCIPDESKTLREGAIAAWGRRGTMAYANEVAKAVEITGVNPDIPFSKIPEEFRQILLYGGIGAKKKKHYEGLIPRLNRWLEQGVEESDDSESDDELPNEDEIGRFCVEKTCDSCHGERLRPEARAITVAGHSFPQLSAVSLARLQTILSSLVGHDQAITERDRVVAQPLLQAIVARLGFLIDVGLDYLSLDRSAATLSGGEGQRIRLATQIGSALVGVLYVLDEPSVGLHARDNTRLLEAIRRLVDLGNSVIMVEHDREAILAADHILDMGPTAGTTGGYVVSQGTAQDLMNDPNSVTGPYLSGEKHLQLPLRRSIKGPKIKMIGAKAHNLQDVTVEVPLGVLTCVTGVSGSGKSSLIVDTLLPAVRAALYGATGRVGACDKIEGIENIDKVISIDQAPIGRTPRSNPATYTGLFAQLRELYAGLPEARTRGYKAGRFSFNVKGGRCEACQGDGVLRVEMHFLPDVFVTCDACNGKRYGRETLEVTYRGLSIADALALTVDDAYAIFDSIPRMRDRLEAFRRVGLGYIPLGQPAPTLSGGEAQRVKLARELARKATGRTLYVLDEPTTGLHFADIELLVEAIQGLCDAGNTVLVIEHNLDVVACADWVIDMGPEGGERGGRLVAAGPPEAIVNVAESHTGRYLKKVLEDAHNTKSRRAPSAPPLSTVKQTRGQSKQSVAESAPRKRGANSRRLAPRKTVTFFRPFSAFHE